MKHYKVLLFLVALLVALSAMGLTQARDKLTPTSVSRILLSEFPDLTPDDIKVKFIKRLTSRVKVNLSIQGKNVILYLTWQRSPQGYRWWFENDRDKSMVYLSKTTRTTRVQPEWARRAEQKAKEQQKNTLSRTELIEISKPEEKAESGRLPAYEQPTSPPMEPEPKAESVIKAEEEVPSEEPAAAEKKAPVPQTKTAEAKPEPEIESPAVANATEQKKPDNKQPETLPVEPEKAVIEPAKEIDKPEPQEPPLPELTQMEPETTGEENTPDKAAPEHQMPEPSRVATTAEAVGPGATHRDFVIAFVTVLGRGDDHEYRNFLLRPSEITDAYSLENFNRGLLRWVDQFGSIHMSLAEVENIEITRILLQRAQSEDLERRTINALRQRMKSVNDVFTQVTVEMLLDGKRAQLFIGGLVLTDSGWRIAGRVELLN